MFRIKKIVKLEDFCNYSGGAIGSDSQWEIIGRKYEFLNHIHYWYKFKNPYSSNKDEITYEQYLEGIEHIKIANKTLKRKNIERYYHLLARNWFQVKNSDAIYAIGILKNNFLVNGGTGWAVQMAIDNNKPVYIFEQNKNKWYIFNNKFIVCNTPILTLKYAGIGTRNINNNSIQAIENVYRKTKKYFNI